MKMTLSLKNNARNGLPSQNHIKMRYYTCSWLHLLKNHIWPWNIWRPFCFLPLKIPPKGAKVAPGWFLLGTFCSIKINHKTSSIPQNTLLSKSTGLEHFIFKNTQWTRDHDRKLDQCWAIIVLSRWPSRPIRSLRYIVTGTRIRAQYSLRCWHPTARVCGNVRPNTLLFQIYEAYFTRTVQLK